MSGRSACIIMHHRNAEGRYSFAAGRVFLDCRGAGIFVRRSCRTVKGHQEITWGPSLLAVKLTAGSRRRGEWEPRPGRPDAAGARLRLRDGRAVGRVPGDPGRFGAGDGWPGIIQRAGFRQTAGSPARPRPASDVTLSDTGGQGERAHCRRSVWVGLSCEALCRPGPRFTAPTGAAGLICPSCARGRGSQVRRPAGACHPST